MATPITIAGIGEILWDILPEDEQLDGAPVNFAYHINALGGRGVPISTLGEDELDRQELTSRGVDDATISTISGHATRSVQASVDTAGVASYVFALDTAWDHLLINQAAWELAPVLDAICFGTLGQRAEHSRDQILGFLDALPPQTLRILDLNLRQDFYDRQVIDESLKRAAVLKLNDDELRVMADLFDQSGDEQRLLAGLRSRFHLDLVILTRGADGCLLCNQDSTVACPGRTVSMADTIGAGDAFTAAATLGLLLHHSLEQIADQVTLVAAHVCTLRGAMPPIPANLRLVG